MHVELPMFLALGLKMHPLTVQQTVALIEQRIRAEVFTQHVVVNTAKLVHAQRDPSLAAAINGCDIVNIDGMGVVWGMRRLGFRVPERVAGIDLFHHLLDMCQRQGFPIFLLGAREAVILEARDRLGARYPKLKVAGFHHGYFWDNEPMLVEKVRKSGAKLLFVAISSPLKERFIHQWGSSLGVLFVMGVGGTFDVVSGRVKRAPEWMQRSGLEWFYRVCQEPGRMWKRYMVTNTVFAWLVLRSLFSKRFRERGYLGLSSGFE
jgi:N-acetylglucosaminyldiphosphoundecaprenol N-acetyl-beta-D-mannosaminyltransferase